MTSAQAAVPAGLGRYRGFAFAFSAYLLWGFLPFYMKAVAHISPYEVVAHRVLWSVPITVAIVVAQGGFGSFLTVFRQPRTLAMGFLTASLISVNWAIYVWAIGSGRALESALGYFINPLVNVALGTIFLGERLSRAQVFAVALAVFGVGLMTVESGGLPWVSLALALSFGIYGYLKKTLPIGPTHGFLLEVVLISPLALAYVGWLAATGSGHFMGTGEVTTASDTLLLAASGLVTAVPLILFVYGARLLRYSTIGLMQYIAPSMIFLTAVFVFHEPFSVGKLVAFMFIWAALVVYTATMFSGRKA
ncbi:EamA family transporter RarD [Pleomorphomonas sp. NRK KF1]|uniref:EamA family transporter RarD n=1 Tax=Pleomorphomonas sp. NRK KF1 TaxID=2943000 RepID=UPI002042F794|nr:EamA family transporter RarD [Pleomorphomonas sp. NRK KF1]MCM5552544.1 EamA family transporter RarD [Pleomorphomonas sp. NRK KF1]